MTLTGALLISQIYVPAPVQQYIQQVIQDLPTIPMGGISATDRKSTIYGVDLRNDEFDLQELRKQLQIPKHIPDEIHQFFLDCIADCCVNITARAATYRRFDWRTKYKEKLNEQDEQELIFKQALYQDVQQKKDSLCYFLLYLLYKCELRIWKRIRKSIQGLKAQVLPKLKQCSPKDFGIYVPAVSNTQDKYYQENFPTAEKIVEHIDKLFSYCFFLAALQPFEVMHEDIFKLGTPKKIYQPLRREIQEFEKLQTKIIKQINAKQITELSTSLKQLHRNYLCFYLDDSHLIIVDGLELDQLADQLHTRPKEKQAQILEELSVKLEKLSPSIHISLQAPLQTRQNNTNPMLIRHFIEQVKLVFNTTRFHPRQWYERNIFSLLHDEQNASTKQLFYRVTANLTDLLVRVVCLQMEQSHFTLNQIIKADDVRRILEAKKK